MELPSTTRPMLIAGDSIEILKELPSESVDLVITSPPYLNARDYEVNGYIGQDGDVEKYYAQMRAVITEVHRILKRTGSFFLNIGDVYEGKSMLLLPENLLFICRDTGFIVRNKCVWFKTNAKPESQKDRFTRKYEFVYFMTKSKKYKFFLDRVKIPYAEESIKRFMRAITYGSNYRPTSKAAEANKRGYGYPQHAPKYIQAAAKRVSMSIHGKEDSIVAVPNEIKSKYSGTLQVSLDGRAIKETPKKEEVPVETTNNEGANPGDVWFIPVASRNKYPHFAQYPEELVEIAIKSTTEKDT